MSKKTKDVEKHVTLLEPAHELLKKVAKKEHRSMRQTLTVMIQDRAKELGITWEEE